MYTLTHTHVCNTWNTNTHTFTSKYACTYVSNTHVHTYIYTHMYVLGMLRSHGHGHCHRLFILSTNKERERPDPTPSPTGSAPRRPLCGSDGTCVQTPESQAPKATAFLQSIVSTHCNVRFNDHLKCAVTVTLWMCVRHMTYCDICLSNGSKYACQPHVWTTRTNAISIL